MSFAKTSSTFTFHQKFGPENAKLRQPSPCGGFSYNFYNMKPRDGGSLPHKLEGFIRCIRRADGEVGACASDLLNLDAFQRVTGRNLNGNEREKFTEVQSQANRWTYLGSGMTHPNFLTTLEELTPEARKRVEQIAPTFC